MERMNERMNEKKAKNNEFYFLFETNKKKRSIA